MNKFLTVSVTCSPLLRVEPLVNSNSVLYLKVNGWSCGNRMPL